MIKNKYPFLVLVLLVGVMFSGCAPQTTSVNTQFDYQMPPVSNVDQYNNFLQSQTIYLDDVASSAGVSVNSISNIQLTNAFISVFGDANGLIPGDEIDLYQITVVGLGSFSLQYAYIITGKAGDNVISGDQDYMNFMANAMQMLGTNGQITVVITGAANTYNRPIIVLNNDLNLTIRNY